MKTQIILLSGKQGGGKTTTMQELVRLLKQQSTAVACPLFAKPIYDMHNMIRNYLENLGIKPEGVKDGNLLQLLGTDWGRKHLGENVWVEACRGIMANYKAHFLSLGYCRLVMIVADCRFKNEFDGFPEALRVRLDCAQSVRKERAEMWRENHMHSSETDLDSYADEGRFDMLFDSQTQPVNKIATMIAIQLDRNCWIENRSDI